MKRLKMTAAALAFCAAAAPAWAQTAGMVTGDVVSADPSNHELTIREQSSQQVRTYKVMNPDVLRTLKSGDTVQVNAADEKSAAAIARNAG